MSSILSETSFASSLHEAIIELYLNVKVRSNDEISIYDEGAFEKEKDKLREVDSYVILDYIKSSIEILMNIKREEEGNTSLVTEEINKKGKPYKFDKSHRHDMIQTKQSDLDNT